jgi:hypothetical protein
MPAIRKYNAQHWKKSGANISPIDLTADVVLNKASGRGIKVDPVAPTYGWRDLLGSIKTRNAATEPTFSVYNGTIYAYKFPTVPGVKEVFLEYHLPHDYAPGTDIYIHTHWSQDTVDTGGTAGVPGVSKWYFDVIYAKGHGAAGGAARGAFSTVVTTSVAQQASTTQYGHMIAEVQLSATTPSAAQLDSDDIEVDALLLVRVYRNAADAADTLNQAPFLHFVDIHYQSTSVGTKQKAPDFYV